MRESREYDETELWDSGKFFTLEELMSESEVKEDEVDEKTLSEKNRTALLREIHGDLLTENERDELVRDCISKLSSKSVGSLTKRESEKQSIDVDEVHRLYFDENWTMKDIAERNGYKTTGPILRIFSEQGWKSRPARTLEIDVNPEEVHSLYFEEGLTLKEVGERLGYKSQSPIRHIFKEQGWEAKKRWKQLDYDRVYELYFERKLPLYKVAKEMELPQYQIICIFDEQGWERRSSHTRRFEINPEDVFKMYYEEKKTMKEIAESYGYRSSGPTKSMFLKQGWNTRRMETVDMDIDASIVKELYFEQELSLEEVGRRIGKTRYALKKLFEKMEWRLRGSKCDSIEEREVRKRKAQLRHQGKVRGLRDEIFGTECEICGDEKEIIHRKDGKRHSIYLTNSLKGLRSIDPDEWAPICKPCHLDVHALMRVKTFEWESIKKFLREAS